MYDIKSLIEAVARRSKCSTEEVEWYSWPQVFANTAGPGGGAGGNTMTTFQIFAFNANGELSKYCCGYWRKWNGEFQQKW